MNELDLNNLEIHNVIGTGADYEVRLAGPIGDTPNMVMKRPNPHSILKNLHASTETRTHKMIQFHMILIQAQLYSYQICNKDFLHYA